jgi:hypothetical protein
MLAEVTNEMGVVVEFAARCQAMGWEIVSIRTAYPDAVVRRIGTTEVFSAEFEFVASNFVAHKHDIRTCDVIICWTNDWPDCPITVWGLDNWTSADIARVDPLAKENV